ncbi:hypothetical protein [Paenibacillus sp. FSL H3-0310]|uniref:hypothetical protein n=1 Tax=Paenibacillus sp. FSL H3-0310 TaxID=2921429 RepID=UPI0030FBF6D2
MRYYCVEMGGTVAGCIWLRVYGTSEMDRADLHMVGLHVEICSWWTPCGNLLMVDSMWKFAHGGFHVEICPYWDSLWKSAHVGTPYGNLPMLGTPCGNLLMLGTPLCSSLQSV